MQTGSFCVLLLLCGAASAGEPTGPAAKGPTPQLVVVESINARMATFTRIQADGKEAKTVVVVKDLIVRTTEGQVLASELWRREMVPGAIVVLSANDQAPAATYLRLFRPGTLVISVKKQPVPSAVELYAPYLGTGPHAGKVVFRWQAAGPQLRPRSVALSYAESSTGPWHLIADNQENRGEYAWSPPGRISASIFLRIQAMERNGAAVQAQTPKPIRLSLKQTVAD